MNTPLSSPSEISAALLKFYPNVTGFEKFILKWRPYICPFHEILRRVPQNAKVLDVGCGIGIMPVLLSVTGRTKSIVGCDTSEKAINIARSADYPTDVDIDIRHLPPPINWPSEKFGSVLCIDVFHHVPALQQREFVTRLVSVCAQNSTLIFKDISPFPWWKAAANTIHDFIVAKQCVNYRSEQTVLAWFRSEGLEIIEHIRLDQLWYSHFLIVAQKK